MKKHEPVIAGFGGQGVMLLGRLLTAFHITTLQHKEA
jgi:Pyruvate/2-oxoacid:ferredoxin oxidoreductase gamma subunit